MAARGSVAAGPAVERLVEQLRGFAVVQAQADEGIVGFFASAGDLLADVVGKGALRLEESAHGQHVGWDVACARAVAMSDSRRPRAAWAHDGRRAAAAALKRGAKARCKC